MRSLSQVRRWWVLALLLAPLGIAVGAANLPAQDQIQIKIVKGEAGLKKGNLYFLALGQQDDWPHLPGGFDRAMRSQGKEIFREIHGKVLLGPKELNKKSFWEGIDWMCENAKADDVVMLFIGCHGSCGAKGNGESTFSVNNATIRPREIKAKLAKLPCQAIVINDACQSGNWPKEFPPDDLMPPNVTALCCCLSTQNSGIQFDITLFEALHGKADYNKDGIVDLDEVIKYCAARIREVEGGTLNPVLHKATGLKSALPLTKANPNLVSIVHKREVFAGIVEKQEGDNYDVHVIGFAKYKSRAGLGGNRLPDNYSRANVMLPSDGAPLMVKKAEGNLWHPACMLNKDGNNYKVRIIGEDGSQTVTGENVRHLFAANPGEDIPRGLFGGKN